MQIPYVSNSQYELTGGYKSVIMRCDLSPVPSNIQNHWMFAKVVSQMSAHLHMWYDKMTE